MKMISNSPKGTPSRTFTWRWLGLMAATVAIGCHSSTGGPDEPASAERLTGAPSVAGAEDAQASVRIRIRTPAEEGILDFEVPLTKAATILDVMESARDRGSLRFENRGSGATAFVNSIEGFANQGSGGHNWIYRINGKLGDRSIGVATVASGDEITWEFGEYRFDADEENGKKTKAEPADQNPDNKSDSGS